MFSSHLVSISLCPGPCFPPADPLWLELGREAPRADLSGPSCPSSTSMPAAPAQYFGPGSGSACGKITWIRPSARDSLGTEPKGLWLRHPVLWVTPGGVWGSWRGWQLVLGQIKTCSCLLVPCCLPEGDCPQQGQGKQRGLHPSLPFGSRGTG